MEGKIALIQKAGENKGWLETFIHLVNILFNRIYSLIIIIFLRWRGYDIDNSVSLGGENVFFQSKTSAIKIAAGTRLGKGTRISAGFKGTIEIGENVLLDDYCYVMAQEKIIIGKNTQVAAFCYITDFNHRFDKRKKLITNQGYAKKPVVIEEDVWLGTHCVILSGVRIDRGCVVGAGSVVVKNIPAYSIAVGNPARVIKKRK